MTAMTTAWILSLAKLGDFIQASALFGGLRTRYPNLILLAAQQSVVAAARLAGFFSEIIVLDPADPHLRRLPPAQALYNLSISPQAISLVDNLKAQNPRLTIFGPQKIQGQLHLPPAQELAYAIMRENRRWSPLNLVDIWRRLEPGYLAPNKLFWPTQKSPTTGAQPKVGLALGAGHPRRRWPRDKFKELAQKLQEKWGARVILLGGPGEKALGRAVNQELGQSADLINLVGRTDLGELTKVIEELDLLIASDTGALHLGAAVGTKTVGLYFGPALAQETGPYQAGSLTLQTLAACAPCPESRPCPDRVCQAQPTVNAAFQAAGRSLNADLSFEATPSPINGLATVEIDEFGFKLHPQTMEPEFRLSQILREATRAVLEPQYSPTRPEADLKAEPDFWRALANRLFSSPNLRPNQPRFIDALASMGVLG
ncbi:MAG: glycosyltransferase family 9 protein [Deltaproteobacteria bacterium]|jgi:ADP-heptose:LPS heptosyltransferase|nr:glycosyltransferase family 9 protein [Deltaproteobacteria bacterium]